MKGIAVALQMLIYTRGPIGHDAAFDERGYPLGGDPLLLFRQALVPPRAALRVFVRDLCTHLELSEAELVTSYVLLERALRRKKCQLRPHTVRPLMIAALCISMKICTDLDEHLSEWVGLFALCGFDVAVRRLGRMERLMLHMLDHRMSLNPQQYEIYEHELLQAGGGASAAA